MFNIGGMELVVVGVLGLVVLGPQRLPGAVRQMAGVLGQVRRVSDGVRTELTAALQPIEEPAANVTAEPVEPAAGPTTV